MKAAAGALLAGALFLAGSLAGLPAHQWQAGPAPLAIHLRGASPRGLAVESPPDEPAAPAPPPAATAPAPPTLKPSPVAPRVEEVRRRVESTTIRELEGKDRDGGGDAERERRGGDRHGEDSKGGGPGPSGSPSPSGGSSPGTSGPGG